MKDFRRPKPATADPDVAPELCFKSGTHLLSRDDDGYCNLCGYQDALVWIKVRVDNIYEDGEEITLEREAAIAAPPADENERSDWEQEEIFALTGTGRTTGEAGYFVEVLESSDPDVIPVGTEYEFV